MKQPRLTKIRRDGVLSSIDRPSSPIYLLDRPYKGF